MNKLWIAALLLTLAGRADGTSMQPIGIDWGDSDSIGWVPIARENLYSTVDFRHDHWEKGGFEPEPNHESDYISRVASASANDGDSRQLLKTMEQELTAGTHYNVCVFNAGDHDVRMAHFHGAPHLINLIPIDHYRDNLKAIMDLIRQHCDVAIWVKTPPIASDVDATYGFFRASDVRKYNAVAEGIAKEHGFYILETTIDGIIPNDVHFTAAGYKLFGTRVSDCVLLALAGSESGTCHH